MTTPTGHIASRYQRPGILILFLAILCFATSAIAQNTKGDKPAAGQNVPVFKLPKIKSKQRGDRANTRDISGRKRIRTKGKSSSNSVVYKQWSPYKDRKKTKRIERPATASGRVFNKPPRGGDRPYTRTRDGSPLKVRSVSGQRARQNVYPQTGPYVNNKSTFRQRNKIFTRPASGKRLRNSSRGAGQRAGTGLGGYLSGTRPFLTRGRKNVYWGKYSKGERPVTTDLTGRPLRMRNFRSAGGGTGRSDTIITAGRRPGKDRVGSGRYSAGFSATKKGEQAWLGDISGRRGRKRTSGRREVAGKFFWPRRMSVSGGGQVGRPLHKGKNNVSKAPGNAPLRNGGGGSVSGQFFNNNGQPIDVRPPGIGANGGSFSGKIRGRRTPKGGGSVSGRYLNNGGNPVNVRAPGVGANGIGNFRGKFFRDEISPTFSRAGYRYSGNVKGRRKPKGGGSVSGRYLNNGGNPVNVRAPGVGANGIGNFRGKFFRDEISPTFSRAGYGYSGNVKGRRKPKGGGSVSGRYLNNGGKPVDVRPPGVGANGIGNFRGKFFRDEISPTFSRAGYGYSGNVRARRPPKGGGSVSGRSWNNDRQPIQVRGGAPGFDRAAHFKGNFLKEEISPRFGRQGYGFSGNLKAKAPKKGGGSISGRRWNNDGHAIDVRPPGVKAYGTFTGNIKANKPKHGGGSVSGKLWNNNEQPIEVRTPGSAEAKAANYSGKIHLSGFKKNYIQNPHANEKSLKKQRPDPTTYLAGRLQTKVKQEKYEKKPHAVDGAQLGIGPKPGSVKAAEYAHSLRMTWSYKHNPRSHDDAMKGIPPLRANRRIADYDGKVRRGNYSHNPSSNRYALDVLPPGKAYARIVDFQGNERMKKFNDGRLHPDSKFAHGFRNNTKQDRTLLMNIKLKWAKIFKKNDTQPEIVKEKERRPRYDKKEREIWKPLYD